MAICFGMSPNMRSGPGAFAAKCKDVTEVLAEMERAPNEVGLKLRVAFHDSCHLQHAQGVRSQPRSLLSKIPWLELVGDP